MSQEQNNLDSTERLRLMDEIAILHSQLSESEHMWQSAMDYIEDAVVVLDTQSRYVFVNRKWCEITGYSTQEVLGRDMIDVLVATEELPLVRLTINRLLQGEALPPYFRHILNKQGEIRTLRVASAPIYDDQSYVTGFMMILHDNSVEDEIERAKNELLSSTAHELRTPVTAIQGITQSILRSMKQGSLLPHDAMTKRLQVIQQATDKLVLLADNLGDVTKVQSMGYMFLPRKQHDLNDIVVKIVEQQKILGDIIALTWDITLSTTPLLVLVSESRIERALNNVLENALKYSPIGGTIFVETKHDGKYATVVIADQGVGIPSEEIAKVTAAFYRASNATSSNYAGIGLGLFFTKTIIDAHNGKLQFKSEKGSGTTVTIELPLIG
jgi:PAS domain S-box-containing protein